MLSGCRAYRGSRLFHSNLGLGPFIIQQAFVRCVSPAQPSACVRTGNTETCVGLSLKLAFKEVWNMETAKSESLVVTFFEPIYLSQMGIRIELRLKCLAQGLL